MKILITSVRAGSGHVRAAEAVLAAFQQLSPSIEAVHVDAIDLVSSSFRRLYVSGYNVTVNRAPSLWGRLYKFWDGRSPNTGLTPLLYRTQRYFADPFFEFLEDFEPDLILSTHFLIPQLLAAEQRRRPWGLPVQCIITDYDVHQFWVSDVISHYYVAHKGMVAALHRHGVPPSRVTVSGIPVHPCFSDPVRPSLVFKKLGLDPSRPVILVLSGGMGLNRLKEVVEKTLSLSGYPQIVTVAGRNAALKTQLDRLQIPASVRLLNLGYVDNMYELLSVSNLVITKPGGLTVSECLAKRRPMILVSPIPGQEERNEEFLTTQGAAWSIKSLDELPRVVTKFLTDRFLRERMKRNIEHCARPYAAFSIAQTIVAASSIAA